MKPKGFTLMEVLIVVVILGVLAGLAVPNYFKTVEKTRGNEAIANLKALHMGQKIRKVDTNAFYGPQTDLALINQNLSVDLAQEFYDIDITSASAAAYQARASRIGGTKVYTIDQTGTITESGSF